MKKNMLVLFLLLVPFMVQSQKIKSVDEFDFVSATKKDFELSQNSFKNSDFVDVVIHSYRHRFGLVAGDKNYVELEKKLSKNDYGLEFGCGHGPALEAVSYTHLTLPTKA